MPNVNSSKLRYWAREFAANKIVMDGDILKCEACDVVVPIDARHQKQRITQHVKSARHCARAAKQSSSKQTFVGEALKKVQSANSEAKEFELDLTSAFIRSGIPLMKINSGPMKNFLGKYCKRHIPDESTLRKNYAKGVYDVTVEKIRSIIGDHPVYFILDETTDVKRHYVLNILVGPLNSKPTKAMLLKVYFLEKTDDTTVMQSFKDACSFLWGRLNYEKVLLVVTDQASYMLKAFSTLKSMFTNLNHVTCLAHSLHRVCKTIQDDFSKVNDFLAVMRKLLLKAPARIQVYKDTNNDLPLPPDVVMTRWDSWIRCALFYCENYHGIRQFLQRIDKDATSVTRAKALVNDDELKDQLFCVATFSFLPDAIEKLEQQGLTKEHQWKIYCEAAESLDRAVLEKYRGSLKRNPDIQDFVTVKDPDIRLATLYAPLVSVNVEKSFWLHENLLPDPRHNLTCENIEMHDVVSFNKFLFDCE